MKTKILAGSYLFIVVIGTILSLYIPKNEVVANEAVVIPDEAIRLRILANSDREEDQAVKRKVRDEVNQAINAWVAELTSLEAARDTIKANLPQIEETAKRILKEEGADYSVKVEFDKIQFPTKLYGDFLYPAGFYEAVLITLGEGKGANWWCVLFPPLCFFDISNGMENSPEVEESGAEKEIAEDEEIVQKVEDSVEVVETEEEKKATREVMETEEEGKATRVVMETEEGETEAAEAAETVDTAKAESEREKEPLYVEAKEEKAEFRFFLVDFFKSIF